MYIWVLEHLQVPVSLVDSLSRAWLRLWNCFFIPRSEIFPSFPFLACKSDLYNTLHLYLYERESGSLDLPHTLAWLGCSIYGRNPRALIQNVYITNPRKIEKHHRSENQ